MINEGLSNTKHIAAGIVALLIGFVFYAIEPQDDPFTSDNLELVEEVLSSMLFFIGATLLAIGIVTTIDKRQKWTLDKPL